MGVWHQASTLLEDSRSSSPPGGSVIVWSYQSSPISGRIRQQLASSGGTVVVRRAQLSSFVSSGHLCVPTSVSPLLFHSQRSSGGLGGGSVPAPRLLVPAAGRNLRLVSDSCWAAASVSMNRRPLQTTETRECSTNPAPGGDQAQLGRRPHLPQSCCSSGLITALVLTVANGGAPGPGYSQKLFYLEKH